MTALSPHAHERRAPHRHASQYKPRMSAVEIVETSNGWTFRLNDRGTHLELALLKLGYGATLTGEDARGMILTPPPGTARPTLAHVAETLNALNERRAPNYARQ